MITGFFVINAEKEISLQPALQPVHIDENKSTLETGKNELVSEKNEDILLSEKEDDDLHEKINEDE